MKRSITAFLLVIVSSQFFVRCSGHASTQNQEPASSHIDSLAFGDKKWVSDGLKGQIYFLPENTSHLPNFDTMPSQGTIYTHTINVPERSWTTGFPGVGDRFEWFGIEYKGSFRVKKAGHYHFRLLSDDGARLYIDDSLVVDNDGLHGPSSAAGDYELDNSSHSIRLQYYQGPRYQIALQLFASYEKGEEQVFSSDNFILVTPGNHFSVLWIVLIIMIVIIVIVLMYWKKKKGPKPRPIILFTI